MAETTAQKIARLNDAFRKNGRGGKIMITNGIHGLGAQAVYDINKAVASFDDFSEDNDPYGEHDFGAITHKTQRIFWKIDYFSSEELKYGSEDPSDPKQTTRVMTIMLVSEW